MVATTTDTLPPSIAPISLSLSLASTVISLQTKYPSTIEGYLKREVFTS